MEMIERFTQSFGDVNFINPDDDSGEDPGFKTRAIQVMPQAGILFVVLRTLFPSVGTIPLSQTLKFQKRIFIGDEITFYRWVLPLPP